MANNTNYVSDLEQELSAMAGELENQRRIREAQMVDITLEAILKRVMSKEADIIQLMSGKQWQQGLREVAIGEIKRAAEDCLWCREFDEKARSNQHILVYTGSHW